MTAVLGVTLRAGTIANMSRGCASRLRDFATKLRDLVAAAPVNPRIKSGDMDETGFRIPGLFDPGTGKLQWLHVASTALMTFYRACAQRGDMLADVVGVVVVPGLDPGITGSLIIRWRAYGTLCATPII